MAIGAAGALNAALLAARILALRDEALRARLEAYAARQTANVQATELPLPPHPEAR
jgi:phosphoribosylcarboxyaminoimidazole (NCAIR) mutase